MKREKMWLRVSAVVGCVLGVSSLASGSVPKNITDDTAIYQELSEIRIKRRKEALSFDQDIQKLARLESEYNQGQTPRLVDNPRLSKIVERVSRPGYSGNRARKRH